MTEDERLEYATTIIFEHARDVALMSVHEMADEFVEGGEISDEDAKAVHDLIGKSTITVSFPGYEVAEDGAS